MCVWVGTSAADFWNSVNPIYFVFFTTATLTASAIMYQGWHTTSAINTISLVCGFLVIFSGVYLLDSIARKDVQSQRRTEQAQVEPVTASEASVHDQSSFSEQEKESVRPLTEKSSLQQTYDKVKRRRSNNHTRAMSL